MNERFGRLCSIRSNIDAADKNVCAHASLPLITHALQDTGTRVAIKKITNVFRNLGDARRILREMKLLRYFRGFEANIVEILDVMVRCECLPCRNERRTHVAVTAIYFSPSINMSCACMVIKQRRPSL